MAASMPAAPAKKPKEGAIKAAVKGLHAGRDLEPEQAREAFKEIMAGEATPAQVGAFLAMLTLDRCSSAVVHVLADVMRSAAKPVDIPRAKGPIVDLVGTGGDGQDTFNISTAAAFVAAGAGVRICKHGNRAASSTSGSADFLEALGGRLALEPPSVPGVLDAAGFAFLFARSYHPAMANVGPIRMELGIRTVFNILGPLTNPCKPDCMVCGVFTERLGRLFAEVFKLFGMTRALVVYGCEGLDELSIEGPSKVWELTSGGDIKEYEVLPATFGVASHPLSDVAGGTAEENVKEFKELLAGGGRPAVRDMILMNASAALYASGKVADFESGAALARAAMADGRVAQAADAYVRASQSATG